MPDDGISTFPESSPGTEAPAAPAATDPAPSGPPKAEQAAPDANAASQPADATQSAPEEGESAADSEAANRSEGSPRNAETRIKQLIAQNKALERRMAQLENPPRGPRAPIPAPTMPSLDAFDDPAAYNQALKKYDQDIRAYAADQALRQAAAQQAEEQSKQRQAEIAKDWTKRESRVLKANPEFDAVKALDRINPSPAMDSFFTESDLGPDLVNYLDANPDEADKLRDMHPLKAVRELIKLEEKISLQIKGIQTAAKQDPVPPGYLPGKQSAPAKPKSMEDLFYG